MLGMPESKAIMNATETQAAIVKHIDQVAADVALQYLASHKLSLETIIKAFEENLRPEFILGYARSIHGELCRTITTLEDCDNG